MSGRITSITPGLNSHGVPYERILNLHKKANEQLIGAMASALLSWKNVDEARARKKPHHVIRRLRQEAVSATELALN